VWIFHKQSEPLQAVLSQALQGWSAAVDDQLAPEYAAFPLPTPVRTSASRDHSWSRGTCRANIGTVRRSVFDPYGGSKPMVAPYRPLRSKG